MELTAGTRLRSAVSAVEVVIVRTLPGDIDLRCGGVPMVARADVSAVVDGDPGLLEELAVGKRYASEKSGVEVMVTKAGPGTLTVGDEPLVRKDTKQLPASD